MKQFKNKLVIVSLMAFASTGQVYASGAKLPTIDTGNTTSNDTPSTTPEQKPPTTPTTPTTPTAPTAPTTPTKPTNPTSGAYVDQIKQLAGSSSCASYSWKGRGRAPAGYVKGVALSYARSLCRLIKTNSTLSKIMSAADTHNDAKDALTHYQSNFVSLPIKTSVAGQEPLRALYVLGMGLGMRESSGVYCEGWDRSAGSGRPSSAGEAGAFQTSYDSMGLSPELSKLYAEYKSTPGRCMLDVFKQGASCSSMSNLGSGAGAEYQSFNKACPAFATEYAMTMLRIQRGHYGPINRKEAEVTPVCNKLLLSVQDMINNDPYACDDLM
ncbi:MAG: hypothetical protein ACXVLQ_11605 [Bacteriovorax sp.]